MKCNLRGTFSQNQTLPILLYLLEIIYEPPLDNSSNKRVEITLEDHLNIFWK